MGRTWTLAAGTGQLREAGDYVAMTVGDAPLVVVRDHEANLRAFHNLCRHRGMVMLEGEGNVGSRISCLYHHWQYGLDGGLAVVPQRKDQFPDLDLTRWGLLPAALAVWEGMVFVHPDPDPPPLEAYLGELPGAIGSFQAGQLHQVAHQTLEAQCNWKLFVENHIDVYHLWYLHERSLGDFDHTRFEHRNLGAHWVSYEPMRVASFDDTALSARTSGIGHIDDRDRHGIGAHLAFPNLMFATAAEFFTTYRAIPVAPDRTVIDLRIRAEPDADAEALVKAVRRFIDEDITACERVQAGMRSPSFAVGPLARTHERPITTFQDDVAAAIAPVGR